MATFPDWWETVPDAELWDPTNDDDFIELSGETQPGGGGSFTRDDASETLHGLIPYRKRYSCRQQFLGVAWADAVYPWSLHRLNPLQHPDERGMRCTSVDVVGYNPAGKVQPASPPPPPPSPPPPPLYQPFLAPKVTGTLPGRVNYTHAQVTAKFKMHQYPFLTDEELRGGGVGETQEWRRNAVLFDSIDPVLDTVLVNTDPFLKWIDTPAGAGPAANSQINDTQLPQFIAKATFVLAWFHVPWEYIANPYFPSKIMACVGKVNGTDDWLDKFKKGTLRLDAPRIRKAQQAGVRPTSTTKLPFCCDIFFPLQYVDPTPGAVTSGGGVPTFRGWNLLAWLRSGKWFSAGRIDDSTKGLYDVADFDTMFTHVQAP